MGSISDTAFDEAMQNGLSNLGNYEQILQDSNGNNFTAVGGALQTEPQSDWGRTNGSQVAATTATWGTWESDTSSNEAGQLQVNIQVGGIQTQFLILDGGNAPKTVDNGTTVEVNPGYLEMVNDGLAYVILNGDSNTSVDYVLYDGGGTEQARLEPADGNHVSYSYTSGSNSLNIGSDLTFDNSSGSGWTVEEIRVLRAGNDSDVLMSDTSISTTVPDGGSITFTKVEVAISL